MGNLGANYLTVDTSRKFDLLSSYYDEKAEAEFVYVQASGAVGAFNAVKIDHDGTAVALTTTVSGAEPTRVGVAQVALASGQFGWVFVRGGGTGRGIKVNALTLCAADVKLYTTATAGAIDDAATDLIQGLVLVSTNAAGTTVATECHAVTYLTTNCQD
jgi:hypothetical protein